MSQTWLGTGGEAGGKGLMGDMMPLQEEQVEDVSWTGSARGRGGQRAVGASVVRVKLYGLHRDGGNLGDVSQFDCL